METKSAPLRRHGARARWVFLICIFGVAILGGAATSRADTIGLWTYFYCESSTNPCGFSSEEDLRQEFRLKIDEVNLQFRQTGIAFRPDPIFIVYGSKYLGIEGQQDDLVLELNASANANSSVVTLYMIPGLSPCWALGGMNGHRSVFCRPSSGASGLVHELGHQFCLAHTFSNHDPITHLTNLSHNGDSMSQTSLDPGELEKWTDDDGTGDDPKNYNSSGLIKRDEDANGNPVPGHDWCVATVNTADPNLPTVNLHSPHSTYCNSVCYRTDIAGNLLITNFTPPLENAMSYYGDPCRGPFSIGRDTFQAFVPQQIDRMMWCRENKLASLQDVCANYGGDQDRDGWCDTEDVCVDVPDTAYQDSDSDGTPDACDLCPQLATSTIDTDGDGYGDACDRDDDNDGCADGSDQHPLQAEVPVGTVFAAGCTGGGSYTLFGFEGDDSDGDGLLNCADPDDDNDRWLDENDACPTVQGKYPSQCHKIDSCPLQYWWDACLVGGGCSELRAKISSVINPNPTQDLYFDIHAIVDQVLYLEPLANNETLTAQLAGLALESFDQQIPSFATGNAPSIPLAGKSADLRRIDIVSATGDVLAVVGEYATDSVEIGEPTLGALIRIELPRRTVDMFRFAVDWHPGTERGDTDGDGIPDTLDNCPFEANRAQADRDRDRVGDVCEAN